MKRISLAVCLALLPLAANAAGLGKMTVFSGLGEPLSAEIELSADKSELSSLSAQIAPAETYANQGVDRPAALSGIKVDLSKRPDGSPVLKISSPYPVNEPFLNMLIQVDWPTGRLLREYTTLLDPPGYGDRSAGLSPAPGMSSAPVPAARTDSKKNTIDSTSGIAAPSTAAKPKPAKAAETPPPDTYRTRRGDTLRSVAKRMQVDDVSLEQMLVGLFNANRDAFIDGNMNQLKVGQIIRQPKPDALQAVSQEAALQEIRVHTANWNAYRNQLAGAVSQSAPVDEETAPQQTVSGKIAAPAADKSEQPVTGPRDVVKLSKSETAAPSQEAAAGQGASAEKLRALEEDAIAQDRAINEVNERIAFFEKQIQDMQQLLMVQNQILSELQKGAQSQTPLPELPKPAETQPPAEPKAAPATPKAEQPKPAAPVADASDDPGLLGLLQEDPLLYGGAGGGLLLLLLLGWAYGRAKRKQGLDSFEQGILTASGLKSEAAAGAAVGASTETSFLEGFGTQDGGVIDTSDVDPISEAEVYMAYGRDAQAEEILKDAIVKEPGRYELHHKLLEIYAGRKDTESFETMAGELYSTLGDTDQNWLKVAEMGHAVDPENPLYGAAGAVRKPSVDSALMDEAPADAANAVSDAADVEEDTRAEDDNSLDFDLGLLGDAESEETTGKSVSKADEIETPDAPEATLPSLNDEVNEPAEKQKASIDFDSDMELPEPAADENLQLDVSDIGLPQAEAEAPSAEEEIESLDFELPAEADEKPADELAAEDEAERLPELPEMSEMATQVEAETEHEDFDFDVSEVSDAETPAALADELESAEPSLDEAAQDVELKESDVADFALDLPMEPAFEAEDEKPEALPEIAGDAVAEEAPPDMTEQNADASVEEIVIEKAATDESANDLDFDFDLDIEPAAAAEAESKPEEQAIPDLDLSGISLDMESPGGADEDIVMAGSESPDVDTKLDLVTAYMDMGDTEGARELLEEVVKEGGPQQRARAQKMLDSLS